MVTMAVYSEVKRLYSSLQEMVGLRRGKPQKPPLHISEPFNFKRETTVPPGMPEDEYVIPSPQPTTFLPTPFNLQH
ncbi:hypothetical protein C8A05DRAFT_11611 [Staphylotrichum tortipilum]|uniref:Uncharacterized protein n=1 Tax=Staphylotrichum tortipilum TaxID=2831512 RepID=A0AAN6RX12_9PEZI|nr:hypothetical protein C8A05DRAFT_11611 [Staphylotrichum longicolle]